MTKRSSSEDSAPAQRRRGRARTAGRVVLALLAVTLLGGAGGGALFLGWTHDLPAFDTLKDYHPLVATRVYGSDGSEVFEFARERRTVLPFDQIPEVMKKAVLASEDAHFYEHQGVNYWAIARCALKGALGGRACGGSTITQQVVKTFLLSSERRISRKVKEIVLARRLEQNLKKDEILYLYLNQIYFGHRRYGVEEAARFYFGKGVGELSVGEAAMIAGLVQSPERLSPVKHPTAAKERQKYVLRRMEEERFISAQLAAAEAAKPIKVVSHGEDPPGAWYADAVRKYLDQKYGAERVETDGLEVRVAMDPRMQKAAEDALEAQLRAVDKRQGWRGAPIHLDPKQLAQAEKGWRERLKAVVPRPGEVLVWDLAKASPDDLEPGAEVKKLDLRRAARVRPLQPDGLYTALVSAVTDKQATIDLGNAAGTLALPDVGWARKYNPASGTAAPKKMGDVLKVGDLVLVRVLAGKGPAPADLARQGKPLPLALEQAPRVQGALVAIDPATRGVRALVGGYDFALSQFNRAIQAKRQPGSAFKPFVWGTAIESRKYSPASLVYDTPDVYRDKWTGKEWKPQNFERDEYDGPLLLKAALAHSKNTVAAKLVDELGVDAVSAFAKRAGVSSDLPKNLTLALGTGEVTPMELVNAYATIATGGYRAEPLLVLQVRDRKGQVLEEHAPNAPPAREAGSLQVVSAPAGAAAAVPVPNAPVAAPGAPPSAPFADGADAGTPDGGTVAAQPAPPAQIPESGMEPQVAYVLASMMRDVVEYGTGAAAKALGRPVAAKTGTAQEHRDAWFVGFTSDLVAGVWVGFDSHDPLGPRETGAGAALPAWLGFMRQGAVKAGEFPVPTGVTFARVDKKSGLLAREGAAPETTAVVPFVAGTVPAQVAGELPPAGSAPQNFFME
ncbi:penicillin-binding protein 1A [Anaeromyxobacter paludicola]|uniref:Penicillin-binding protein 1A n=1 Tax=Anaeromyxobacter paludicola TaxID=2918171 RepID=A0ABN6N694_9BACT|nr:PBP1A family penicillin-binding protein [Anaeromyxobacter paludicola]BDG08702.1 penicillin-binding protein 1A [Anaeromyxobacter paludicola]